MSLLTRKKQKNKKNTGDVRERQHKLQGDIHVQLKLLILFSINGNMNKI